MSDRGYKVLYLIETFDEELPEELIPEDRGACDAMLLIAIRRPEKGGRRYTIVPIDADTEGGLNSTELFGAWVTLTQHLRTTATISWHRDVTTRVMKWVEDIMLSNRNVH